MRTTTSLPTTAGWLDAILASPSTVRVSSTTLVWSSLRSATVSTSNRRCDPPCRSRPRFRVCLGMKPGRFARIAAGMTFGAENSRPITTERRTRTTFQRERVSIGRGFGSGLVVGRGGLVTAADVGDHRLHHLDRDALGDLEADFGLFHPDHLADHPRGENDAVAALQGGDGFLVLFHPLLLWADHQEVEQRHHRNERQELDQRRGVHFFSEAPP